MPRGGRSSRNGPKGFGLSAGAGMRVHGQGSSRSPLRWGGGGMTWGPAQASNDLAAGAGAPVVPAGGLVTVGLIAPGEGARDPPGKECHRECCGPRCEAGLALGREAR